MSKKKEPAAKEKKIPVFKIGVHRKMVAALWILLIFSVSFGVYKNFTAVNTHTIYKKEMVEKKVVDTNGIEAYVKDFAGTYFTWVNTKEGIEKRTAELSGYLTKELQSLNLDGIRADIPVSSKAEKVEIWSVKIAGQEEYNVCFSVAQQLTENGQITDAVSHYETTVHIDKEGNMVIVQNPTVCGAPGKSDYEPEVKTGDGTVDAVTLKELNEFLSTFFKLYPSATDKEMAYYIKGDALKPINRPDYVFAELVNPVYVKEGEEIYVSVTVKYLDQLTKTTQLSQFELKLEKENNWIIVE